jgi:nucleotide-binding universal stress UspA family protein
MYRNILALIPTELSVRPVVDGSISLAVACQAQVEAVAVGYEVTSMPWVAEGGAAVASIFEIERQRALERAEAALGAFEVEAKYAGITCRCHALSAPPAEVVSIIGARARLHDVTILSQPDSGRDTFDNKLVQETLFQAGGPVLFMPYTFRGAFAAKRIGICWDGSRLAARALRDAMPLLKAADALNIITINTGDNVPDDASAARLAQCLAQAGLPARQIVIETDRSQIQSGILSLAADESLDLLVMGGYGHSRLKEIVLGGVTREMLHAMTVPTLMSH